MSIHKLSDDKFTIFHSELAVEPKGPEGPGGTGGQQKNIIPTLHGNCENITHISKQKIKADTFKDLNKGHWKNSEHQKLIQGLFIYGKNWKMIKNYVKSRSIAQIRSHSQKYWTQLKKKLLEEMPDKEKDKKDKGDEGYIASFEDKMDWIKNYFADDISQYVKKHPKDPKESKDEYYKKKIHQFHQTVYGLMFKVKKVKLPKCCCSNRKMQCDCYCGKCCSNMTSDENNDTSSLLEDEMGKDEYCGSHSNAGNKDSMFNISSIAIKQPNTDENKTLTDESKVLNVRADSNNKNNNSDNKSVFTTTRDLNLNLNNPFNINFVESEGNINNDFDENEEKIKLNIANNLNEDENSRLFSHNFDYDNN
jgi:SHAQKYF class myb-like DNA-binding protein